MTKANAVDPTFDAFVNSLHADKAVPMPSVGDPVDDPAAYFKLTGLMAVTAEQEDRECPVFGNWGTYYEFEAWRAYREMNATKDAFKGMVSDILDRTKWSPDVSRWVTIIDGLLNVQQEYVEKYGHEPVNTTKFIKSYVKHGTDTVLRADVY